MNQSQASLSVVPSRQNHWPHLVDPIEPPVLAALKARRSIITAAQVHHVRDPRAHPEWLLFQWSLRALGMGGGVVERTWAELLRGVKLQEDINERLRARRLSSTLPRPSTQNSFYARVAEALGPHLQVEPGRGPMALWSGPYDVSVYAQLQGYTTLEATPGGRALSRLELYRDPKATVPLWKHLSREFVRRNPNGEAHVFLLAHDANRPLYNRALPAVDKSAPLRPTVWHPVSEEELATVRSATP